GIRFDEANGSVRRRDPRLFAGPDEHLMAEVRADNRHSSLCGPVVGQGQVASAGAQVENRPGLSWSWRGQPGGARPPALVNIQTERMVQKVIPRRDLAKHPPDAGFALVEEIL